MAVVNYRVKSRSNPTAIYARFRHSRLHDYEIKIGFEIDPKRWSKKKQQINLAEDTATEYDNVNSKLRQFKDYAITQFNVVQADGIDVSRKWFEGCINDFFNRSTSDLEKDKSLYLTDFAEWYIEFAQTSLNPKTGKQRKRRTIQDL